MRTGSFEAANNAQIAGLAAAELVQLACSCKSQVELVVGSVRINAKSLMGVLYSLNSSETNTLTVIVTGKDEDAAFDRVMRWLSAQDLRAQLDA